MFKQSTNLDISDAEWEVMRIVWTLEQAGSRTIIEQLQLKNDWTASTIKTLLRRLCQKGYLTATKDGRRFIYTATVDQTAMMYQEATVLLDKMCDMHKGELLIKLLQDVPISKRDLAKLSAEIKVKEQTAPDRVKCNCLSQKGCEEMCN